MLLLQGPVIEQWAEPVERLGRQADVPAEPPRKPPVLSALGPDVDSPEYSDILPYADLGEVS